MGRWRMLTDEFAKRIRNRLRVLARRSERSWVRTFRSFDGAGLVAGLRNLGVSEGDDLMLHSAFDPRHGFRGGASDVADTFVNAIGPDGCLLMVSLPYRTSTAQYLRSGRKFDVRRTPSAMGLVSESFRRRPGVVRSEHPTHPVLAAGGRFGWYVRDHQGALYPCGPGTPFGRLVEADAKLVFFNVGLETMTFFHYLEHLVSPKLPFGLYEEKPIRVEFRGSAGGAVTMDTYVFSQEAIRRRRPSILHGWILDRGLLHSVSVGASRLLLVEARKLANLVEEKAAKGEYFYDM